MEKPPVPDSYQRIMPYLIVQHAAGFVEFMKDTFGATEKFKVMRDENLIMHGELNINGSIIMYADANDVHQAQNAGMFIYVENCDKTYEIAIDNGSVSLFEPGDKDYGRGSGVRDPFGNTWWITSAL